MKRFPTIEQHGAVHGDPAGDGVTSPSDPPARQERARSEDGHERYPVAIKLAKATSKFSKKVAYGRKRASNFST
jgi:hypothetical protein